MSADAAPFELYALRYARLDRLAHENMLFCPADMARTPMPIDYYFWVARRGDRIIVIDTGYSVAEARGLNREFLADPLDLLADLGIQPDKVDTVVLTHLHYDHAGNVGAFPNAKFYLNPVELEFGEGWYAQEPAFGFLYNSDHLAAVRAAESEGRLRFVQDNRTLEPGIELLQTPGHSPGHMSLRIQTQRGSVILMVDAAHFSRNHEMRRPFPVYTDITQVIESYDFLREMAETPAHLIAGHDSELADIYPSASDAYPGLVLSLHETAK